MRALSRESKKQWPGFGNAPGVLPDEPAASVREFLEPPPLLEPLNLFVHPGDHRR